MPRRSDNTLNFVRISERSDAGAAAILSNTFLITSGRFPSRHNTAKVTSPRFSLSRSGAGSMLFASTKRYRNVRFSSASSVFGVQRAAPT
jgi:hypothetical protein